MNSVGWDSTETSFLVTLADCRQVVQPPNEIFGSFSDWVHWSNINSWKNQGGDAW